MADPDLVKLYAFQVFSKLEGAVTAGMIHLGDRLGLYRALASAEFPMTSDELADAKLRLGQAQAELARAQSERARVERRAVGVLENAAKRIEKIAAEAPAE